MERMPKWADVVLTPLISLALAFAISALVILAIGESPVEALKVMVEGALGSSYGWGFTLYYATNFVFTGLAVMVAYHAGLFNIGGEGQAAMGGLGATLVILSLPWPHWALALPAAMIGAAGFGALWALIPAWLQARRGSHVVITTIMFNFIAAALLNYMLVNVLRPVGSMDPASANFPAATHLPKLSEMALAFGITWGKNTPANITLFIALAACVLVWLLIWRTRLGYEIRAFGKSEPAALYAGISPVRITVLAMLISGALAGLMAINNVMGEAERLVLNAAEGAGFIGIAVALMGRNHPVGVVLAAILFGALTQGGSEMQFEMPQVSREFNIVIQGLVIFFVTALDQLIRKPIERWYQKTRGA